jgi:hypothetical protein
MLREPKVVALRMVAGHRSAGKPRGDVRLPLRTRLRVILGFALASWIPVGLAAYAALEILAR